MAPPKLLERVIRVRTVGTISQPAVRELVMRAAAALPGVSPGRFYEELAARIGEPALGVFVGFAGEVPQGLVVGLLPTSCMVLHPEVTVAFNDGGSTEFVRLVAARVREWFQHAGYSKAAAINVQRSDQVFTRGLRYFGRPEKFASMVLFHF